MKKLYLLTGLLVLVPGLLGCGSDNGAGNAGASTSPPISGAATTIGATVTTTAAPAANGVTSGKVAFINVGVNDFTTCFFHGLQKGFDGTSVEVVDYDTKFDPSKQQSNIEDAIATKASAAVMIGLSSDLDGRAVQEFADAKVPIVYALNPVPSGSAPTAAYPLDIVAMTKQSVEQLATDPTMNKLGLITGPPGQPSSDLVLQTLQAEVPKLSAGVQIVATVNGEFTPTGGASATEDLIQSHPDVNTLMYFSEEMALAGQRVLDGANRADIKVVVYSAYSQAAYDAIANGKWAYAMALPIGTVGADIAHALAAGTVSGVNTISMPVLTKDNVKSAAVGCF
jgi:ribose transport system substrate-binding protein